MDNETYSFKFDDDFYIANFAYTPSSTLDNQLLFKGILGGSGILIGRNCVVRANVVGTKASWESFRNIRRRLKSVEEVFRANNARLNFYVPKSALAAMDKTALPTKVASSIKGWRPPKEDEFVMIDMYQHRKDELIHKGPLLSAISHISLMQSQNQSYLTNFRAFEFGTNQVCITNAQISKDVDAFRREHSCNELCEMKTTPNNHSDPIPFETEGYNNLLSYPVSAPPLGEHYFWNPFFTAPPPYSEHPTPTAPSIYADDYYYHPRNMSVS